MILTSDWEKISDGLKDGKDLDTILREHDLEIKYKVFKNKKTESEYSKKQIKSIRGNK